MKRVLLLLLICLLPLRALSAEVMGLGMALPAHEAGEAAEAALGAMPADCPMMKMAGKGALPDGGKGCKACQLCMEVAGVVVAVSHQPRQAAARPLYPSGEAFSSADLAAVTEPPRGLIPLL